MKITKELLKQWNACSDGYKWFLDKFPQGGDVHEIGKALREDRRYQDSSWLVNNVFSAFLTNPDSISEYVKSDVAGTLLEVEGAENSASGNYSKSASSGYYSTSASSGNYSTSVSSGNYSKSASSGYYSTSASSGDYSKSASSGYYSTSASSGDSSKSASSGNYSKSASSGNYSKSASSGYYSKSASSGNYSTSASSGDYSKSASSGNYSKSASSGNYSKSEAKGIKTVAIVAGLNGMARAGEKGAFALAWLDKSTDSMRITVGTIGVNAVADVWYKVDNDGNLISQA